MDIIKHTKALLEDCIDYSEADFYIVEGVKVAHPSMMKALTSSTQSPSIKGYEYSNTSKAGKTVSSIDKLDFENMHKNAQTTDTQGLGAKHLIVDKNDVAHGIIHDTGMKTSSGEKRYHFTDETGTTHSGEVIKSGRYKGHHAGLTQDELQSHVDSLAKRTGAKGLSIKKLEHDGSAAEKWSQRQKNQNYHDNLDDLKDASRSYKYKKGLL